MNSILICNTGKSSISKWSLLENKLREITLRCDDGRTTVGPYAIDVRGDEAVIVNKYSSTISTISLSEFKEKDNYYIGANPTSIKLIDDYAYVTCGDTNSLMAFNLRRETLDFEVKLDDYPKNMAIDYFKKIIFIANTHSNSISLIDYKNNEKIRSFHCGVNPMNLKLSTNKKFIFICEGNLGEKNGYLGIYSTESLTCVKKIEVGKIPIEVKEYNNKLYVANYGDGTMSIITLNDFEEKFRMNIGGNPKDILIDKEHIYVSGSLKNGILTIDKNDGKIKIIATGKETNAMTFSN